MRIARALFLLTLLCGCSQRSRSPVLLTAGPHALSPDGHWLATAAPPYLVNLVTGEAAVVQGDGVSKMTTHAVSWAADSSSFLFRTPGSGDKPLDLVQCSVPNARCVRLDVSALEDSAPERAVGGACYLGSRKAIVTLMEPYRQTARFMVAEIKGTKLLPFEETASPSREHDLLPLWVYGSADSDFRVLVAMDAVYRLDVRTLGVVPVLYEERVRDLTGTTEKELTAVGRVGDVMPGIGGKWIYAAVYRIGMPTIFARVDMTTGEAEKLGVLRDAVPPVSPSPDGERIAFARRVGSKQGTGKGGRPTPRFVVCVSDPWLREVKQLTAGKHCDRDVVWDEPLGDIIFVRDYREIWAVPIEDAAPRRIWGLE